MESYNTLCSDLGQGENRTEQSRCGLRGVGRVSLRPKPDSQRVGPCTRNPTSWSFLQRSKGKDGGCTPLERFALVAWNISHDIPTGLVVRISSGENGSLRFYVSCLTVFLPIRLFLSFSTLWMDGFLLNCDPCFNHPSLVRHMALVSSSTPQPLNRSLLHRSRSVDLIALPDLQFLLRKGS